jgi:hypothetical protein
VPLKVGLFGAFKMEFTYCSGCDTEEALIFAFYGDFLRILIIPLTPLLITHQLLLIYNHTSEIGKI